MASAGPNSPVVFSRLLIHTPEPYLRPSSEKRPVELVLMVRTTIHLFTIVLAVFLAANDAHAAPWAFDHLTERDLTRRSQLTVVIVSL
jgi:hypothetical protein